MRRVTTGLERLLHEGPSVAGLARRARVGLLAHPASVDGRARHAVELLAAHPELSVQRLFAPEHGVRGEAQDMEAVAENLDPESGLPIVSLYGTEASSLRPAPADLDGLDAVVYDLQDVGSRYYTYVYTLSYVMEAARERDLAVVVLDRPNPIGGVAVEGPVLEPVMSSFVGRYPLPVRHGLTSGELAGLFNDRFGIGCDLRVVTMKGWRRAMEFERCGLPWVAPSPNMPSITTARVYPGGCLVEGTNLSEGRGTTRPFELVGAPWLDGPALAARLTEQAQPGVWLRATSFRPEFHKHRGRSCHGVQVHVADDGTFRPFATYLALLIEVRALAGEEFAWRDEPYEFESERLAIDLLLGRRELRRMIEAGCPAAEIEASWEEGLKEFLALRREALLYPDGSS